MDLAQEGWPLGLEPVHFHKRVLDTLLEDDQNHATAKISNMSSSDATSGLETESSSSSRFFPEDKPVTLGEILGMSLNHLASTSFRSIELHVLDHSAASSRSRNRSRSRPSAAASPSSPWMICSRCVRASSTSSNRYDDSSSLERIYTNSIFEQDGPDEDVVGVLAAGNSSSLTLLDHFRRTSKDLAATAATENPLFLLECGSMSP